MRKDVRSLVNQGYYHDKSNEEFASDAVAWVGDFDGIESYMNDLIDQGYDRNQVLDLLCDYGMNSLF